MTKPPAPNTSKSLGAGKYEVVERTVILNRRDSRSKVRDALEITTEEISIANEIIGKQSHKLAKLKKTIGWRTEVALHQEKAIKEKDKQLIICTEQIHGLHGAIEALRKDIPLQLQSMKEFADSIETKYSQKITALGKKISSANKENIPGRTTIR